MAILRWDPWGELASLQHDMQELMGRSAPQSREGNLLPPIDVFRDDEGTVVRMELPGMTNDDVDVQIDEGMLTVTGERSLDQDVSEGGWIRRERRRGRFERSFALPEGTDADAVAAHMAEGVLEIRIPHPPERQPRRIEVASGDKHEGGDVVDVG